MSARDALWEFLLQRCFLFNLRVFIYYGEPQREEQATLKSKDTQFAAVKLPKCFLRHCLGTDRHSFFCMSARDALWEFLLQHCFRRHCLGTHRLAKNVSTLAA